MAGPVAMRRLCYARRVVLSWFRERARHLALVVFMSLGVAGGLSLAPHVDDCHDAGSLTFVEHDAAAHRFSGALPAAGDHPLHCLVCHWARSFRLRPGAVAVGVPAVDVTLRVHVEQVAAPRLDPIIQRSLRSPPLS